MRIKTALLAMALSAGTLLAQPGPRMRGPGERGNLDALKQVLELTDQQVEDIRAARVNFHQSEVQPLAEQVREKAQALREEMRQESPNASIVGQLQVDLADLRKQVQEKRTQLSGQIQALLTESQKVKLAELQQAASLMPAIVQARALHLIEAPEGRGPGSFGPRFGRMGRGPRGPR